ncbi:MAG: GTP cyclohydrolase I [Acidobacteria bacterium]|nr:GTP cyclohydrolase I [Acidobacteriota bacterium]
MNRARMEEGIRLFLDGLLDGMPHDGAAAAALRETPRRVAAAYADDLLAGYAEDPAAHLEPLPVAGARGPVLLHGIRFVSVCAHHLLPFRGEAHVGFVPDGAHVGIGSIARLVDTLARRLTLQEQLTAEIADQIWTRLQPRSVLVAIDAEHLCLSVRGARKTGHRLRTVEHRGEPDPELQLLAAPDRW